ncbi:Arc-like DNA binding domain-containing protein [Methylomagnum ishizawai]|uniref:Arc-like DNA binding domain-containing protein n=1 Tax=Methylomagnum ishizawai TaxID=1760988 RepID=A0A1Y6CUM4_9GAMM|nr:Arc family DNA-binding protein [Methylomagnum ishizawai]SMF93900.1 Arc-like DNA binding domain-containing protein [Methylomagnum ishizawai]
MAKKKQVMPLPVRLPSDIKEWIADGASRNYRSLNSEIVFRLKQCMDAQKNEAPSVATARGFDVNSHRS